MLKNKRSGIICGNKWSILKLKINKMSSIIGKDEGVYNPALRFAFTNITDEDFVSAWNNSPIIIKAHQTVELPHHLADKLTDELVDKIMIGEAKMEELEKNQQYYRSPKGISLGIPAARKPWEDKIVRQMEVDEESPELQVIRAQIREELTNDLQNAQQPKQPASDIKISPTEFSELGRGGITVKAPAKKPLKTKVIK